MSKDKLTDYSATAGSNTDIGGINIDEGMLPSNVNNAIREQMSHLADAFGAGTPLYVDQTNNRVGIGTASPSVELEIASSAPQMRITDTDTNAIFQINASSTTGGVELQADTTDVGSNPFMAFDVGGSEKIRILDSGDVGIGTSSPSTALDVSGTVTATAFVGDGSGLTGIAGFPSGTLMLFQQTAAPTGWTKQTTHNDKALRVVSGTAGSGGSVAFTTALGTPSVSGSVSVSGNISSTTLSTSQIPSHAHGYRSAGANNNTNAAYGNATQANKVVNANTNNAGGGGSHNHGHNLAGSLSSASTTINVQYVDLIIAAKD